MIVGKGGNPVPYGKISVWPKFKTFADDKINVAEMMISLTDRVENIVLVTSIFSLSHNVFYPFEVRN